MSEPTRSIRPLLEGLSDYELASCTRDLQDEQQRRNLRRYERLQAKERELAKLVEHRYTLMTDVHRWYDQAVESLDKVYPDLKEKAPIEGPNLVGRDDMPASRG